MHFLGKAIIYFEPGRLKSCKGIQISHWENDSEKKFYDLYFFIIIINIFCDIWIYIFHSLILEFKIDGKNHIFVVQIKI